MDPPFQVHHLVGVAVTPVVCYIGEVGMSQLNPNPSEVSECFTVPLEMFIDNDRCVYKSVMCKFVFVQYHSHDAYVTSFQMGT